MNRALAVAGRGLGSDDQLFLLVFAATARELRKKRHMDPMTSIAAGGVRARMEALELLANNIANAGTQGFKADREFYNLYSGEEAQQAGMETGHVPIIDKAWIDFSQGTLQVTGNQLDTAISGRGFYVAQGPKGPLYTRNGAFHISKQGVLQGPDGYPVNDTNNRPITLDPSKSIDISADGTIKQQGQTVARLAVVDFPDANKLQKQGVSYYRNPDPEKNAAKAATFAEIQQGKAESSNVGQAEGAVRLVSVMRQFEILQKAITIGAEMNKRAGEEVAKVTP